MIYRKLTMTLAALAVSSLALASGGGDALEPANVNIFDSAALQRGARLYVDYCSGCHSAKYMRYKRLAQDLQLSEEQVLQYLAKPGSKIGDAMTVAWTTKDATDTFGVPPPDLSLVSRTRGNDWLLAYMKSFYVDDSRPLGWNNTLFANASMPHVLWELQGVQRPVYETVTDEEGHSHEQLTGFELVEPGLQTAEEYEETIRDLVTFLAYMGEPAKLERHRLGVWVVLFLSLFAFISYLLKSEYWQDVKK
ncbi:MAG: cytochrome c1 [Wenzhouxiangellaceae bacterium]